MNSKQKMGCVFSIILLIYTVGLVIWIIDMFTHFLGIFLPLMLIDTGLGVFICITYYTYRSNNKNKTGRILISSNSDDSLNPGASFITLKIDNYNVSQFGDFSILLNNNVIDSVATGKKTWVKIPSGKYELTLEPQNYSASSNKMKKLLNKIKNSDLGSKTSNKLNFTAGNNDITITCFLGMNGDWFLINEEDTTSVRILTKEVKRMDTARLAAIAVYLVGVIVILSGLALQFIKSNLIDFSWVNSYSLSEIAAGLILLGLGFGVSKKSNIALIAATVFLVYDTALLINIWRQGGYIYIWAIIVHLVFIIPMIQGIFAIYLLKKNKAYSQEPV